MEDDCIFCKIIKGEIPAEKVYEDDNFIGILDINPESEGHTLIFPKKHFESFLDMPSSLGSEFVDAIKKVSLGLVREGKAKGFNIVFNVYKVAGQEVPHVHAHIIPRKSDDGCKLKLVGGLRDKKMRSLK